jgi:hypothetical protein
LCSQSVGTLEQYQQQQENIQKLTREEEEEEEEEENKVGTLTLNKLVRE